MVIYLIVNEQKKITFINDCFCVVDLEELEKAIIWYSNKPVARLKHIYMHGSYPAISIYKEKLHIHRLLMMYWLKCILPREYSVHHINGDKLNALKENLSVVLSNTHQSRHNKGKKLSVSTRQLIALSNRRRKGIKQKKTRQDIDVETVIRLRESGMSINAIAINLGCDRSTVKSRINEFEHPHLLEGAGHD